jgi:hypothetical protein
MGAARAAVAAKERVRSSRLAFPDHVADGLFAGGGGDGDGDDGGFQFGGRGGRKGGAGGGRQGGGLKGGPTFQKVVPKFLSQFQDKLAGGATKGKRRMEEMDDDEVGSSAPHVVFTLLRSIGGALGL